MTFENKMWVLTHQNCKILNWIKKIWISKAVNLLKVYQKIWMKQPETLLITIKKTLWSYKQDKILWWNKMMRS